MWIKALARSLMVVVGVFAIVKAIELLNQFVMFLLIAGIDQDREVGFWIYAVAAASLIIPGVLFVAGFLLIFRPPKGVLNLIPEDSDKSEGPIIPAGVILGIVSTFIGVLFLFLTAPRLVAIVYNTWINLHRFSGRGQSFFGSSWPSIIVFAVELTAGIYFLLGAPHFVRWQLKRMDAGREKVQ